MKKVVMTGCPRSGTTALCTVLSHDPRVFISNEVGNFSYGKDNFGDRVKYALSKEYVSWMLDNKNISQDDFLDKVSGSRQEYCSIIHNEYQQEVVGDKLPGYIECLLDIYRENPDAYYIITLRSVQHFVTSSNNHFAAGKRNIWTFETIDEAQKYWVEQNSNLIVDVGQMIPQGAKLILIRYEDIGPNIDQTIKRISDFLGYEIKVHNPRGGFEPPHRPIRKFTPSSQAQFLMDILGY
tara:strand:- start:193 stop:906 length:714 start_codon:yes stop_codon:yes gene_type:complete